MKLLQTSGFMSQFSLIIPKVRDDPFKGESICFQGRKLCQNGFAFLKEKNLLPKREGKQILFKVAFS